MCSLPHITTKLKTQCHLSILVRNSLIEVDVCVCVCVHACVRATQSVMTLRSLPIVLLTDECVHKKANLVFISDMALYKSSITVTLRLLLFIFVISDYDDDGSGGDADDDDSEGLQYDSCSIWLRRRWLTLLGGTE